MVGIDERRLRWFNRGEPISTSPSVFLLQITHRFDYVLREKIIVTVTSNKSDHSIKAATSDD